VVLWEGWPVGTYFHLLLGDTVFGVWGATLREYLSMGAAYLAYWSIYCDAAHHGYHFWDLGRSPAHSNASRFKGKWGGHAKPVYQQVASLGPRRDGSSIVGRVRSEQKFQRFRQIWAKLPFPVVQFLGPILRRHVPFA
jgi:hypothetical protein